MGVQAKTSEASVFVVDDNVEVCEGIKALVESAGLGCETFQSCTQFLKRDLGKGPHCLILDVRLPEMSGLDFQRQLTNSGRTIPTIMITGHGDIAMSVRAMKTGAVEFLTKPLREQDVLDAVYAALNLHRAQLAAEERLQELRTRYQTLSNREREIMPLVTAGLLNKQIAAEIGLSEITVKVHRHNLIRKLHAKSLPELVRMADLLQSGDKRVA
jgi:FixJ family two-component response regulator